MPRKTISAAQLAASAAKAARAHKSDLATLLGTMLARTAVATRPVPKPGPLLSAALERAEVKRRRTGRVGYKRYKATPSAHYMVSKVRRGTFRLYMLTTILAHTDTRSAVRAHELGNEYPTHRLDFAWAADNGYIEFES